jgi:thioredoxin reductase (NADPH)
VTVSRDAGAFAARLASGREIVSLTLVLATGTRPRPWHVGGCEDLPVHRDVRTLPADLDDRTVAIVGGGDAALDSALSVHSRGGTPVVLVRGGSVAANARIARRVEERSIEVRPGCAVDAVSRRGDRILVAGLEADHLLVCIGREPDDVLYRMLVPDGPLPPTVETHVPGLFVAGDIIAGHERFVALAQGNGQRAALLASRQGR